MSIDPQEVAAFKAALARTHADKINRLLNGNTILRSWKRELAEAEVARRAQTQHPSDFGGRLATGNRHQAAEMVSWLVTAFMIACAIAVVAAMTVQLLSY